MIEVLAILVLIGVVATPLIGTWLERRRFRNELRNILDTSEAEWAVQHREWVKSRMTGSQSRLYRDALIDAAESDSKAFALDDTEQPHPTRPAA